MTDQPKTASAPDPDRIGKSELDRLALSVTERFAPHLLAAETTIRDAERELLSAQEALARSEREVAERSYRSDPLVFMRATVGEDVAGLARKTTPKKLRASFRYLLDRAVELAEGEVASFERDLAAGRLERSSGVAARRAAVEVAEAELASAQAMHQRVLDAESAAKDGLAILREKS